MSRFWVSSKLWLCVAVVCLLLTSVLSRRDFHWPGTVLSGEDPPASQTVVVGNGFFDKQLLINDAALGTVTDIIRNPTDGATLGVAGLQGAVFLKADHSVVSRVTFEVPESHSRLSRVQFVATNTKGVWEYLDRGGHGWSDASLYGKGGQLLWVYGGMPGLDDMAAGDLDGDGRPEFVAGLNGAGGLRCLDDNSHEQWHKPGGNIWHVEIVDADGKPEIIHTGVQGGFAVRDRHGKFLREMIPGGNTLSLLRPYCSNFSLCPWPDPKKPTRILTIAQTLFSSQIVLCDFDGKVEGRYSFPGFDGLRNIYGTAVRWKKGEPPLLAVMGSDNLEESTTLVVFKGKSEVIFQEKGPGAAGALLAVPVGDSGIDDLLVGRTNTVERYSFAKHPGPPSH